MTSPFILTYSGICVDLWNPDPATIHKADIAHHSARIGRFCGAGRRFISVAQHGVHVSYICPPECAKWSLLHDAEEAYLGDWTSPCKRLIRQLNPAEFDAWITRWKCAISERFNVPREDVKEWDMQSMLAERRDNGPWGLSREEWLGAGADADAQPHPDRIFVLTPEEAEKQYLRRWAELFR